jgi:photosystem II stability/assembly factor-like uncharacterized protein
MKRFAILCAFFLCPSLLAAQDASPVPQILHTLRPRCIGPANMSGRITEIAIYEKEPRIQYAASATGGLWKTVNHGTTWTPYFERESTISLGAVAVSQSDYNLVWVGTGEANARNSVSWGDGVYKSIDGGKSFKNMGLKETEHIGRVVINPKNSDIVYVAALGKLWAPNKERGVFKTTDAGKTWQHVLAIDEDTGCIDLAIDHETPDSLYAAMYQVRRGPFSGGNPEVMTGPGSGLYKTTDGGKSWKKMTAGLPNRPLGRCGFSIYRSDARVLYAIVQTDKTDVSATKGQDANQKLDLDAGGVFRSDDRGATWKHVNSLQPRPFYYGQIRVDPNDSDRVYVLGVQFHLSNDGGNKFLEGNQAKGTHVDYHALWIDPRDSHHLILGCDGGMNYSFDMGKTWEHCKNIPVSQFYAIGVDMRKPYRVYGGLQDNGTWSGPSTTRDASGISTAQWVNHLGYDGYYCVIHPQDDNILYCEGQYGILRRINLRTGALFDIKPRLDGKEEKTNLDPPLKKGSPEFRFNWSSPIVQSPYVHDDVFYGANVVFHTRNRGDSWQIVSPDLTRGKPGPNDRKAHTISTLSAQPGVMDLLYAGTDDGKIWRSKDLKKREWIDLSDRVPKMPQERWITRLEPSRWNTGWVYLTIDRHRNNDYKPYVFKSTDYGQNWVSIVNNLPEVGHVHVIREDFFNKDVLYAGTEFGLFISLDGGKSWHKQKHLPTVPVHDLVVHPRERELVIGTHGRGIWIMDVRPLHELDAKALAAEVRLLPVQPATAFRRAQKNTLGIKHFVGENAPYGAGIYFYLRDKPAQPPTLAIADGLGNKVAEFKAAHSAGLHRIGWDLNRAGTEKEIFNPVPAGAYIATLRVGKKAYTSPFRVEVDD